MSSFNGLYLTFCRMDYQNFEESGLLFSFSSDWVIKRYDTHAYFRVLAGYGLKGVDFIGVYKGEFLYLIEVKNYRKRKGSPVAASYSDIEGDQPLLVEIFISKIDDALKLIRIVIRALKKKQWFRILSAVQNLLGGKRLNKDWKFWKRVHDLSTHSSAVQKVLFLELDPDFLTQNKTSETKYLERIHSLLVRGTNYDSNLFSVLSTKTINSSLRGVKVKFADKEIK